MMKSLFALALVAVASICLAQEKPEGPCKEIKEACEKAGFVKNEAKEGYGLWADCIDPIMKGAPQPSNAKKPLPAVGADLVNACNAKHPNFGQGHGKEIKK